jgi:polar amino acid transport system substrate-binding protein
MAHRLRSLRIVRCGWLSPSLVIGAALLMSACSNSSTGAGAPQATLPPAAPTAAPAAAASPKPVVAAGSPSAVAAASPGAAAPSPSAAVAAASPSAVAAAGASSGASATVAPGAAAAAAAGTCQPDKTASTYPTLAGKSLKVGLDPTLPPIMFRSPTDPNKIVGQDPDMIDAAMQCLGLQYQIVPQDFGTLVPALQAGQLDLIWSNIYYTPERGQVADFVVYGKSDDGVIVAKGNPKNIHSMDDLCGTSGAVILGTGEEPAYRDQSTKCTAAGKPPLEVNTYPNAPAAVREIENKRADSSMFDLVLLDQAVKESNGQTERAFAVALNLKLGVAVKKGNDQLEQAIFNTLKILQANGTQTQLYQKNGIDPAIALPTEILK